METEVLAWLAAEAQEVMVLIWQRADLDYTQGWNFYTEGDETLECVAHRASWWPIPENIQHQVKQGSGQYDPVEGIPAHCRRFGVDDI